MIERDRLDLSVGRQCALLSISRSSFYYRPVRETERNPACENQRLRRAPACSGARARTVREPSPAPFYRPVMPGKAMRTASAKICRAMKGRSDLKISPKLMSAGATDLR